MNSATMHRVVKYAAPTIWAGKEEVLVKRLKMFFSNANYMNHTHTVVSFKMINGLWLFSL